MNEELIIEEGTIEEFMSIYVTSSYNSILVENNRLYKFNEHNISTFFKSFQQLNRIS